MSKCATCCDKGYTGLRAHESFNGFDESKPCPDCRQSYVSEGDGRQLAVDVGTAVSSGHLRNWMIQQNCQMNRFADEILSVDTVIPTASIRRRLKLKVLPLSRYSFNHGNYRIDDVVRVGLQRSYQPCPGELAAQFRLQYARRPLAKLVIFGMAPFNYRGHIWTFIITDNEEGHSLRAVHYNVQVLSPYPPGVQHAKDVMTVWLE